MPMRLESCARQSISAVSSQAFTSGATVHAIWRPVWDRPSRSIARNAISATLFALSRPSGSRTCSCSGVRSCARASSYTPKRRKLRRIERSRDHWQTPPAPHPPRALRCDLALNDTKSMAMMPPRLRNLIWRAASCAAAMLRSSAKRSGSPLPARAPASTSIATKAAGAIDGEHAAAGDRRGARERIFDRRIEFGAHLRVGAGFASSNSSSASCRPMRCGVFAVVADLREIENRVFAARRFARDRNDHALAFAQIHALLAHARAAIVAERQEALADRAVRDRETRRGGGDRVRARARNKVRPIARGGLHRWRA